MAVPGLCSGAAADAARDGSSGLGNDACIVE
jgi:hypothetical protein